MYASLSNVTPVVVLADALSCKNPLADTWNSVVLAPLRIPGSLTRALPLRTPVSPVIGTSNVFVVTLTAFQRLLIPVYDTVVSPAISILSFSAIP
jgi:hypothetical protein